MLHVGTRLVGLGRDLGAQLLHLRHAEAVQELREGQVLPAVGVRGPENLLQLLLEKHSRPVPQAPQARLQRRNPRL